LTPASKPSSGYSRARRGLMNSVIPTPRTKVLIGCLVDIVRIFCDVAFDLGAPLVIIEGMSKRQFHYINIVDELQVQWYLRLIAACFEAGHRFIFRTDQGLGPLWKVSCCKPVEILSLLGHGSSYGVFGAIAIRSRLIESIIVTRSSPDVHASTNQGWCGCCRQV
jgi:hypothetical protein